MLYHGTKVPPKVVMAEGLKPAPVEEILREVREAYQMFDLYNDQLRDYIRRKRAHLFVYMTDSYAEAVRYALSGGNFRALLEREFATAMRRPWNPEPVGYVYSVDLPGRGEVRRPAVSPGLIVRWERIAA